MKISADELQIERFRGMSPGVRFAMNPDAVLRSKADALGLRDMLDQVVVV